MPPHPFAYLDLASGSMIIQAAIAGVVAVPILLRNRIRRLLGRGATVEAETVAPPAEAATSLQAKPQPGEPETSRP